MLIEPEHKRWKEFLNLLGKDLNFRFSKDVEEIVWECNGDFNFSIEILKYMGVTNIEENLEEFRNLGAFCDCEIIFNIMNNLKNGENYEKKITEKDNEYKHELELD